MGARNSCSSSGAGQPAERVPAAQYLRVSSEEHEYSLARQETYIRQYASGRFQVVASYEDFGRSGLTVARRPGLKALISDVLSGDASFKAILVYDVTRWGRFQNTDEAGHYEFLCRSAGVSVHYCAEPFANDSSTFSTLLKGIKRSMAAEYSREMGARIYEAQRALAARGFLMSPVPGYALRRMLVSEAGVPQRILERGEWKGRSRSKVVLVPGPEREQQVVRQMFQWTLEGESTTEIARRLNERGLPNAMGRPFQARSIRRMLRNPHYAGCLVWGRVTCRLERPQTKVPSSGWVTCPGALAAIVDPAVFEQVQRLLTSRQELEGEYLLRKLTELLNRRGRLSQKLISYTSNMPSVAEYMRHFGTVEQAYASVGYKPDATDSTAGARFRQSVRIREQVIAKLIALHADRIVVIRGPGTSRPLIVVDSRFEVTVLPCTCYSVQKGKRWVFRPQAGRETGLFLACALTEANDGVEALYLISGDRLHPQRIRGDHFERFGPALRTLEDFPSAVAREYQRRTKRAAYA